MTVFQTTYSGAVAETIIYRKSNRGRNLNIRPRFENAEERKAFNAKRALMRHIQQFNATFSPSSLYSTLTFNNDWEVHTWDEARIIRRNFYRRLKRAYPDAIIYIYMGRGKGTARIHFHMVSEGLPADIIQKQWIYGEIIRIENLRKHNRYNGIDYGQDYSGLATYLYNHWTEDQGGKHLLKSNNDRKPEKEEVEEISDHSYSERKHPKAPKGYRFVESKSNHYGFLYFKYVKKIQTE